VGDVAWLTGLLAGTAALVTWLVKWIVRNVREDARERIERERQISDQWRRSAEIHLDNDRRTNEILGRILLTLERPPWVATAPAAGWDGSPGYDTSRHRRSESPWPR